MRRLAAVLIVVAAAMPAPAASQIASGALVEINVVDAEMMHHAQTFELTPELVKTALDAGLTRQGLRIAGEGLRQQLLVTLIAYDSGSYVGFAKTARMQVGYRLQPPEGSASSWQDACVATAKFDMQSTARRNADAVRSCLAMLARQLATRLTAPE